MRHWGPRHYSSHRHWQPSHYAGRQLRRRGSGLRKPTGADLRRDDEEMVLVLALLIAGGAP